MTAWQLEKIYEYTIHWAGCHKVDETTCVILIIKFCFSLIGLNSIFSTLSQSEYTLCEVYSVFQRCPTRDEISFPVGQSNYKKGQNFQKVQNLIFFLKIKIFI